MPVLELGSDVWLVANSCEEGLGDLRGMKAVVERFGARRPGLPGVEGTALGQVYHRAVGVQRYRVSVDYDRRSFLVGLRQSVRST